jgi:hypothetical protein
LLRRFAPRKDGKLYIAYLFTIGFFKSELLPAADDALFHGFIEHDLGRFFLLFIGHGGIQDDAWGYLKCSRGEYP